MRGTFAACFRHGMRDDVDAPTLELDPEAQWSQWHDSPPPQHPASAETCA